MASQHTGREYEIFIAVCQKEKYFKVTDSADSSSEIFQSYEL